MATYITIGAQDAEARGSLEIQGWPAILHNEFQDSQGYLETLSQKSQEEFIEEPLTLLEASDNATYS